MGLLQGKVAVITGGTRGFGLAMAQAYVEAGASVVIASRSQASVDCAVTRLDSDKVGGLSCDVTDLNQVQALKNHAVNTFGHLDIWVNNAGIAGTYGPTAHIAPEEFKAVVNTNIIGAYHGSWVAMQHFVPQGHGKLINILGHGEQGPVPMQNAYSSSKGWLRSFTMSLAKEYVDSSVGVYALNPGMMKTDLLTRVDVVAGYEHKLDAFPIVIQMLSKPPAIPAQKAVWLASTKTDGRTGIIVRESSWIDMLIGAVREGVRRLLRRPTSQVKVALRSVPSALRIED